MTLQQTRLIGFTRSRSSITLESEWSVTWQNKHYCQSVTSEGFSWFVVKHRWTTRLRIQFRSHPIWKWTEAQVTLNRIRFSSLSDAVLNPIYHRSFGIRPRSERSGCGECDFDIITPSHLGTRAHRCIKRERTSVMEAMLRACNVNTNTMHQRENKQKGEFICW